MLEHNEHNDRLVLELRELQKKAKEAANEEEKKRFIELAEQKRNEIMMVEFGDKNIGRFTTY